MIAIGPRPLWFLLTLLCLTAPQSLSGEPIPARHREGTLHGFLALRTAQGKLLAAGDLAQTVDGDKVDSTLAFHFKDGSVREENTVFSQKERLRVLTYHLIQKGPAFKEEVEMWVDVAKGEVKTRVVKQNRKEEVKTETVDLPEDLANGMLSIVLKNVSPEAPKTIVSLLAAGSKPRLVKLEITNAGEGSFLVAGSRRKCIHYVVKVQLGGAAGLIAPVVGKQPPDTDSWILTGNTPAFLRSQGPVTEGGPIWRIELASPSWSQTR